MHDRKVKGGFYLIGLACLVSVYRALDLVGGLHSVVGDGFNLVGDIAFIAIDFFIDLYDGFAYSNLGNLGTDARMCWVRRNIEENLQYVKSRHVAKSWLRTVITDDNENQDN